MQPTQQQYLSDWHDSFVNYINQILTFVEALLVSPQALESDKEALNTIKVMLHGEDIRDVERDLSDGVIKQSTLDKIEKINKDLVDMAFEHLQTDIIVKQFLKQLTYLQIDRNKRD